MSNEKIRELTEEEYEEFLKNNEETKDIHKSIENVLELEKIASADSELKRMIQDVGEKYDVSEKHI